MIIPTEKETLLYKEYHKYSLPRQPAILCKELVKRNYGHIKALALDLEYTLTTDAESQWPRPGLLSFLENVKNLFKKVVIFTAVSEKVFRGVAKNLVAKKDAPEWFADIEYIEWPRTGKKDLSYIPGIEPHEVLLVDDHFGYVHPKQLFQYISITEYETINYHWDFELNRVLGILEMIMLNTIKKETVLAYLKPFIDDNSSGIKRAWLYGPVVSGDADSRSIIQIAIDVDQEKNEKILRMPFGKSILYKARGEFGRYFWAEVEVIAYPGQAPELKKKIDDESILIMNTWEAFNVVFTRTPDGIAIEFPDLPGCKGFCPNDGKEHFDQFTIQAYEPASEALEEWLAKASPGDIPEKRLSKEDLKKQYPNSSIHESHGQLPWRK
ncbi:MAG: hypothetical protein GY710_05630 [Desulfobacteraceae bacterium]|nr:hypothetical protein [Desulfobacteraceae bacterium]